MASFSRHRSYTEKVLTARKRRRTFGKVILFLLILSLVRMLFLQSYVVKSPTMRPFLEEGDRLLSFPLPVGAATPFGKLPHLSDLKRGELIIAAPDPIPTENWWFRAWDSLARFFTLQNYSPLSHRYGGAATSYAVYRVVGLPGDTIRLRGSVYEIRAGAGGFLSEYLLSEYRYTLSGTAASGRSGAGGVVSGELTLGAGEFFVACDDRSLMAGSALWGPIGWDRVVGRVVAVFWPPRRMRLP